MHNGHQGWRAQLQTGEWVYETALAAPGELSSWQMLLIRCRADNLRIVNLQLFKAGVLVSALHKCDGYIQASDARFSNLNRSNKQVVQGIGSVIGEKVFICWVDDRGHVSQEVRDLKEVFVHSTIREKVDVLNPRV